MTLYLQDFVCLDTATVYRNEEAVGKLLEESIKTLNLSRKDIFITSKLGKFVFVSFFLIF